MNPNDRTQPRDTWNQRTGVTCPGCRPLEWYGVPRHEPSCAARTIKWYVEPPIGSPGAVYRLLTLANSLDPGLTATSPAAYEDRQALRALAWLIHAAWHVALRGE